MLLRFRRLTLAFVPVALLAVASAPKTARADDAALPAPGSTLVGAQLSGDSAPRVTLLPQDANADASTKRPTRMNNRALFGTGVAMSTLGTAGLVVLGGVFYANMKSDQAAEDRIAQHCTVCLPVPSNAAATNGFGAITSFIGGGVFTAIGIPMIVVGSMRKPTEPATEPAPPPRAEFSLSAARASMTVHF